MGRAAPEAARNSAGKLPTSIPDEYGHKTLHRASANARQHLSKAPHHDHVGLCQEHKEQGKKPQDPPHTEKHWMGRSPFHDKLQSKPAAEGKFLNILESIQYSPPASTSLGRKLMLSWEEREEGPPLRCSPPCRSRPEEEEARLSPLAEDVSYTENPTNSHEKMNAAA